ncbi:hypothetical protein CHS0354_015841 [Potamilus streckersoni]|uniref:C1q domain-containing protein n=1 Tax=Potamilus streckersoni TaxID=2493646 RepID=A0AAE0VUU0_9BIVA|nr:hypothetical protein CHS0354_015841 [Potamilus streckersoni]
MYFTGQVEVDKLRNEDLVTTDELLDLVRKMKLDLTRLANEQEKMKAVQEELLTTKEELFEARKELQKSKEEFLASKEDILKANKELILTPSKLQSCIKDLEVAQELLKEGKKLTTANRSGDKVESHTSTLKEGAVSPGTWDKNIASESKYSKRGNHDRNARFMWPTTGIVGFTARLTSTTSSSLYTDQTLVFDNVYVNEGNGYDATTGIFHAPVAGMYVILVTISSVGDYLSGDVEVLHNGVTVCRVVGPHSYWGGSPCNAIIHLAVGDTVWVREYFHHQDDRIRGDFFTTFSMGLMAMDSSSK